MSHSITTLSGNTLRSPTSALCGLHGMYWYTQNALPQQTVKLEYIPFAVHHITDFYQFPLCFIEPFTMKLLVSIHTIVVHSIAFKAFQANLSSWKRAIHCEHGYHCWRMMSWQGTSWEVLFALTIDALRHRWCEECCVRYTCGLRNGTERLYKWLWWYTLLRCW